MIILIWTQVGYAMVLLSSAIKGDAGGHRRGRPDRRCGRAADLLQHHRPADQGTVITVFITVLIGVMKVFDIVYVTTNGAFNTDVIGRRFYNELFTHGNNGYARRSS